MVIHRQIKGDIKNVTVSKTPSGKYYASIVTELDIPKAPLNGKKSEWSSESRIFVLLTNQKS